MGSYCDVPTAGDLQKLRFVCFRSVSPHNAAFAAPLSQSMQPDKLCCETAAWGIMRAKQSPFVTLTLRPFVYTRFVWHSTSSTSFATLLCRASCTSSLRPRRRRRRRSGRWTAAGSRGARSALSTSSRTCTRSTLESRAAANWRRRCRRECNGVAPRRLLRRQRDAGVPATRQEETTCGGRLAAIGMAVNRPLRRRDVPARAGSGGRSSKQRGAEIDRCGVCAAL